jgi:tetratricopeptide (TPR) repeat protein
VEFERTIVATAGRTGGAPAADVPGPLPRGTAIGRYLLLGRLGAGAMGVVYAAHDPELDRKVALKLLLPGAGGRSGPEGRVRLLREAQALAKLSHPNVVAVHDVGTHDDSVWIAMEFVAGQTLDAWARQRRRRWPEVVQVLTDAARGVAAAHLAGLVHRDLKPDNVMIDEGGRVRVMDFGLAHEHRADPGSDEPLATIVPVDMQAPQDLAAPALWRTQAGSIRGTPAYMAPEQWQGHAAESATDQFGWSVMAWELLYGERPFAGDTLLALGEAVVTGQRRPAGRGVPGWLRRVLERGLATAPAQRWPTMTAMLAALERGRTRTRMRTAAAALAGVVLLGAGVEGARRRDIAARVAICEAAGAEIDAAWNDERRQRLREALVATGVSYAGTTAERVMPWLDEQAAAWRRARTDACLNNSVRDLWSDDLLGRAQWCLEDRQMELESLVTELGRANATVVQKAVSVAARLRPVDTCMDEGLLLRQPAPPTHGRDAVRELRAEISRAQSIGLGGDFNAALIVATRARERAQRVLDWPPLLAAARMREGNLLERTGAYEQAEIASTDAYFAASSAGAWEVAARAATQLIYIVGLMRARPDDGREWARHAAMAIAHAGDRADLWEAERLNSLAVVSSATGGYAEARQINEQALAIFERALGPDHPSVAMSLNNLAAVHEATGAFAEARALNERALAIRERALGPDHPDVAMSLNNLANVQAATGGHAQARALHERALAIKERALGPTHPSVGTSLNNLAQVLQTSGDLAEARALHERALTIKEQALGPTHPDVAMSLLNLGSVALAAGEPQDALPLLARAVSIVDTTDSVESFEPEARFDLARALVATRGDQARALAEATRARDGYRQAGASKAGELAEVEQWLAGREVED